MNVIVLDIETTGDNYNIDEICQMSYFILDEELQIIKAKNFFFKVDYVHFKSNKSKLNINELKILSNDKMFSDNSKEIFNDLNGSLIVCHNVEHDINFIKSEFLRCGIKNFNYNEFCTMKYYTNILKIKHDLYGYKYPRLEEIMPYLNIKRGDIVGLCEYYFREKKINLHDSRFDTSVLYHIVKDTNEIKNVVEKIKKDEKDNYNNVKVTYYNSESNYKALKRRVDSSKSKNNEKYKYKKWMIKDILFDLFSFENRIGRREYIYRIIFAMISATSIYSLSQALYYYNGYYLSMNRMDTLYHFIKILENSSYIYMLWLLASTNIKRFHDINKNGAYLLTLIFPIINIITILNLIFREGITRENKFGLPRSMDKYSSSTKKFIKIGSIISIILLILSGSYVDDMESANMQQDFNLEINNSIQKN